MALESCLEFSRSNTTCSFAVVPFNNLALSP